MSAHEHPHRSFGFHLPWHGNRTVPATEPGRGHWSGIRDQGPLPAEPPERDAGNSPQEVEIMLRTITVGLDGSRESPAAANGRPGKRIRAACR